MQFLTCRRPPMQMLFLLSYQRCVFVRTPIYLFVNFHGNGSDAQTGDKILTAIGSRDRMLAHFHLVFPPHKSVAHKGNWTSFKSTARMLTFALPWACVLSYCSQRRRGPLSLSIPPLPHIQHVKRDSLAVLTYNSSFLGRPRRETIARGC